jgi:6-phosphogluconolactonase (cycloisomerase 2 family)
MRRAPRTLLLATACLTVSLALASGASATYVYVSNSGSGTISVYSTNSNGTLSPISCADCAPGRSPNNIAITPNAQYLYMTDITNNVVRPYRINADGTLTQIACTGSNCATGSGPYYDTVSPDGRFLYVTNNNDNTISVYAIGAAGSLTAVPCSGCHTGTYPEEIALTPDGKFLYEPNYGTGTSASTVSIFSVASDGTLTPVPCTTACATGNGPEADAITPDGKYLYVANLAGTTVSAYTISATGTLTPVSCSGCTTGSGPGSLAVGPRGDHLYSSNGGDSMISPFTINADGSLTPIACPGSNCSAPGTFVDTISPDGRYLYSLGSSSVQVFAVGSSGSLTPVTCPGSNCNTGTSPNYMALTPDQAPTAGFVAHPAHPGHATSFDGSISTAAAGQSVARYDWSFGDGHTLSNGGATPKHTYKKAGTYKVTLTVTDNAGCSASLVYTGAQTLCNGGPSARVTHTVKITAAAARLTARPRTARAHVKTCFTFTYTSGGHGLRGGRVHFAGHTKTTSHTGKVRMCLALSMGTYTARATKSGYKTARTAVRITAATRATSPGFTG